VQRVGGSDAQSFISFTGCTTMQYLNACRSSIGVSEQFTSHTNENIFFEFGSERGLNNSSRGNCLATMRLKMGHDIASFHSMPIFTVTVSHTGRRYRAVHILHGTTLHEADLKPSRAELWTSWHQERYSWSFIISSVSHTSISFICNINCGP
jgi:hypothetical protein